MENSLGISDSNYLLELFPEVVWDIIFENVNQIPTYYKACASSQFVDNLLSKHHLRILFPKVVKVFYNHYSKKKGSQVALQCLQNFRSVCQSWKLSVDQILQNLQHHYYFSSELQRRPNPFSFSESLESSSIRFILNRNYQHVATFKRHFQATHFATGANPFIYRAITILGGSLDTETRQIYAEFLELLAKCGHHLWYCKISMMDLLLELTCLEKMKEMLRLMPNLKVITIECHINGELTEQHFTQIREAAQDNPIPTLTNLQCVKLSGLPAPLSEQLWQANPQITMLDSRFGYNRYNIGNVFQAQLPNLEKLGIGFDTEEEFREFEEAHVRWRLTKLDITVVETFLHWEAIFAFIHRRFGESLEELWMWLPDTANEDFGGQLTLPKLKILNIRMSRCVCLDFLLPMRNCLEQLCLEVMPTEHGNLKEEEIKFYCHGRKLHRSNIWTLFPKLQTLQFSPMWNGMRLLICTREQWKQQNENRMQS